MKDEFHPHERKNMKYIYNGINNVQLTGYTIGKEYEINSIFDLTDDGGYARNAYYYMDSFTKATDKITVCNIAKQIKSQNFNVVLYNDEIVIEDELSMDSTYEMIDELIEVLTEVRAQKELMEDENK